MKAHEVSFLSLVQGEKQFLVPLYQRTYSWTEREQKQLWRDLTGQAKVLAAGETPSPHFIGSVVLAPSPTIHAGGLSSWLVVDGQQRLTTLMVLLAAIRDHVRSEDAITADRIHRQYLVNEFQSGDEHLRLLPTQADRDAYRSLVTNTARSIPGSISEAYELFRRSLAVADDPDDPDDINRIEQIIRTGLSIVEITAERDDNVYRIFESLNNTGLRLSQSDLLRNYLFMRLPSRGEELYRDVWLPLQRRLDAEELELLIWLDLVIRGSDRVKQNEIYRAQQLRLEALRGDPENVIEREVREIARRSHHLDRILRPETEPSDLVRRRLQSLREWGAQTSYPLVMHLMDLRERGIATDTELADAIRSIESYLVRRMLCQVPTNNLNRVFNSAPIAIGQDVPVSQAVRAYLSGRRRYWPTDDAVRSSARTRPFYWTGRANQRMFVLRALERSYDAPEPVDFAAAKLTIEHVLPQTPTDEWLELLAADVVDEAGPQELHDLLVHTLGNLTLTAENSRLSNHPFQRKQDIFHASALRMNREIAEIAGWGKAQILGRADRLAERILQLWPGPLDDGGSSDADARDWSLLRQACATIPSGAWTSYGEIAEAIGSHPVPVGAQLATKPMPNAWRVLTANGRVSRQFKWLEPGRDDDPADLLRSEGVHFIDGHADEARRVSAREIAGLIGLDVDAYANDDLNDVDDARQRRFLDQLNDSQPDAAIPVFGLLSHWRSVGGDVRFGRSDETSAALTIVGSDSRAPSTHCLVLYPRSGVIEVPFEYMKTQPVFADSELRRAFRDHLAAAVGVDIPDVKLSLRPALPMDAVEGEKAESIKDVLTWFAETCRLA
jgi:alkylated DNA nucleotide flippase Atl1